MNHEVLSLSEGAFEPFGRAMTAPSGGETASDSTFSYWSEMMTAELGDEVDIGWCEVWGDPNGGVSWMERHVRTPEMLIPVETSFVLPVMTAEGRVSRFRVSPGEAVLIGRGVWHSACLPADGNSKAGYFVLFRRGTPAEDVEKTDLEARGTPT